MSQVFPVPLVAPGSLGLNKEQEQSLLDPRWATTALNCVLDKSGRLAARKGWVDQTTTGISGDDTIDVLHEYIQTDGDVFVITAANNKIYKDIDDYTDANNNLTATTAPTADNWQFLNFNDDVWGVQESHTPIYWDGAAAKFVLSAATGLPTGGNCGLAAFGRLWILDSDKQTIKYCALLDGTDWNGADTGSIIMSKVWTRGMDTVVALAAVGSRFVVFGKNHIIVWEDGTGSEIGLDPTQMVVVDTIEGTGCAARDSIQATGEGDLLFLSRHGVQSLNRVIEQKNNPMTTLTKNIRSQLSSMLSVETASAIRSVHHAEDGLYLQSLPASQSTLVLDTRRFFVDEDGDQVARLTQWQHGTHPTAMLSRNSGALLFGFNGVVGLYSGQADNDTAYDVEFMSAWLQLPAELEGRLKILKEVAALLESTSSTTATLKWEFDFSGRTYSKNFAVGEDGGAEFNVAEYSIAEYSGSSSLVRKTVSVAGEGQFIRVGIFASVNGFNLGLQQLQLYFKIGRMI